MLKFNKKEIDKEEFLITDHKIGGQLCHFVRPKPNKFKWTQEELIYRSAIFLFNGDPVSLSYPKFFNLNECPHINPFDGNLTGTSIIDKLDGSTLIVSKFRDEYILRTRGTDDAGNMPNAQELDIFKEEILPKLPKDPSWQQSWLFEWCSPTNKIILDYGPKPKFYLTNIVNHYDYSLTPQSKLDSIAEDLELLRPERFTYYSLSHLVRDVENLQGREGICLYYNNDQNIRKIKSLTYLKLHAFKSQCNLKNITELYIEWGSPDRKDFEEKLSKEFDYECLTYSSQFIEELYRGVEKTNKKISDVRGYVSLYSNLNQKDFAVKITTMLSGDNYQKPLAFALRKGSETSDIKANMLKFNLGLKP